MSRFTILSFAAGASLSLLTAAPAAHALDLPPAVSSVTCGAVGGNIVNPTSCVTPYDQAHVSLGPAPTVSASGDYPGALARVPAGANAQLTYYFAVLGGNSGDHVHLDIAALLHWETPGNNPNAYAFSRVIVTTSLGEVFANICTNSCGVGSGLTDFFGGLNVDAASGSINTVEMDVVANPGFSQDANSASAFADPMISIDLSTPNAGDYSLVFSDGVGNSVGATGGVPEPAAWALMVAGFGLAGLRLRRRSRLAHAGFDLQMQERRPFRTASAASL